MTVKNRTQVKICGKEYTLKGLESNEYIYKVASYIDDKMTKIMSLDPRLSENMAAVLAALNIADDYFKVSEKREHPIIFKEGAKIYRNEIEKYQFEVNKALNDYMILEEENKRIINENNLYKEELSSLKRELFDERQNKGACFKDIENYIQEIELYKQELKRNKEDIDKVNKLKEIVSGLGAEIKVHRKNEDRYKEEINRKNEKIESLTLANERLANENLILNNKDKELHSDKREHK